MSCGSGCCAPRAEEAPKQTPPVSRAPTPEDGDRCRAATGSVDHAAALSKTKDGCSNHGQGGCCSNEEPPRPDDTPGCCEAKGAPCCDESCLDRLALRQCEDGGVASSCHRGVDGNPCSEHARQTRSLYGAKIEALACICRALIALGQESCCSPGRRSSATSPGRPPKGPRPNLRVSAESRGTARGAGTSPARSPTQRCRSQTAGSCVGHGAANPEVACPAGRRADPCCADERPGISAERVVGGTVQPADLETGLAGERQRVVLSISGMTCTGCETKLLRSLGPHPAVRNLKTSLVLARAEFDLAGTCSVAEVIRHLERTTEFKAERVLDRGSNLDIRVHAGDVAAFVNQPWPAGVTEVAKVDDDTVNVSFDARIVGARDLLERGWAGGPLPLAPPRPDPTLGAGSRHVRHVGYTTLLSVCLTIPVLVMAWAPLPADRHRACSSASLALATLVQVAVAGPFYPKALKALVFSRVIEMDLLVVLSTSAAYVFSVVSFGYSVSGEPLSTGEFFETSTLLVTLIMVGRWVGALARQKAVESISIRSLQTPTAVLVTEDGEREIDGRLLQYGDVFKVAPDSRIPTDGTVISGSSDVDESMITGESRPVTKHAKSPVIAGSVNGPGTLLVRLTRLPGNNTVSVIAGMVDQAKLSKPRIQDVADRVAGYFVPVVVVITVITFCAWIAVGVRVRRQSGGEAAVQAISRAIAVLIVSCPCAIGLAVPMVIVIATGVAAERGVIFKSARAVEVAYKASHLVFDKTGTITEGKLTVAIEWYATSEPDAAKSLLLGLVGSIKHPVSTAVAAHLRAQGVSPAPVSDPEVRTGRGVEGVAGRSGPALRAGNARWLGLASDPVVQSASSLGCTTFCFTIGGSLAAVYGLRDSIRSDAAPTIKALLASGVSVHILSGDDDGAVRSVARQLSIPETNTRARCTPADKQAYIQALLHGDAPPPTPAAPGHLVGHDSNAKKSRKKPAVVVFCGDGTNDAVALATATVGVHMNHDRGATDVAATAADVVLMRPTLAAVLTVLALSRKAMRRVAFNFGWSFAYNLLAVLLAAGVFGRASIPPQFAGLGELVSVLPVIAAAVLLRWSRI